MSWDLLWGWPADAHSGTEKKESGLQSMVMTSPAADPKHSICLWQNCASATSSENAHACVRVPRMTRKPIPESRGAVD